MPTSTFTPGDEKQDERNLNPGNKHGDNLSNRLGDIERSPGKLNVDDLEKSFAGESAIDAPDSAEDYARHKEANAAKGAPGKSNDSNYINNVTPSRGKQKKKGWFKKAGPALGIGGMFGIGGFALIALTSPSLLIVQMKEMMVEKFNTQLASMEVRSNKLIASKVNGATKGCGSIIAFRCKFTTMSTKQVDRLKAAGIEVKGKETVTGRIKPSEIVFRDKTIAPRDFSRMANTDSAFRSALKTAYNPKFAGFMGKAWSSVATRFKINKKTPVLDAGKDRAAAKTKMNDIAREGTSDTGSRTRVVASDEDCRGSNCISKQDAEEANAKANQLDGDAKNSAGAEVRAQLSGVGAKAATNFFKITGPVDYACQVYGAVTALTYAAKAIRAAQLVRYAMIFFSVADAIKAGDSPDPADVALLGDTLTTTIKDSSDSTKTLVASATDSFGYKYASYGDVGAPEQSMLIANRFMAGGGFVGEISAVTGAIIGTLGGRSNASSTCGFLANPFVQGGSIILGVAMLFVPGANAGKIAASIAAGAAVAVALAVLPGLLADIVAGTVTDDLVGEEAGNAITSGSGMLMSDALAAQNGNGPMPKDAAAGYLALQTQVTNEYIAYELENTSPFDATNPHTFLGTIASTLTPLRSSSNPLTFMGGLFASSVRNITPNSQAITSADHAKALEVCKDMDAQDAGYAVDPFCNVIRGIPLQYLYKDPVAVIESLMASGDLSESEQPTEQYKDFISKCITADGPIGYSNMDAGFSPEEAAACVIKDSRTADRYLHYMDKRIDLGLDDEDTVEDVTNSIAGVAIDMENLTEDSTGIACAPNTIDKGTSTGYTNGKAYPIRICALPNSDEPGKEGGMAIVNSRVSGAVYAMLEQMKQDIGVSKIPFVDSFRSPENQQAAIDRCGLYSNGGCAAAQGYSNHQSGMALDFEYTNEYCVHRRGIVTCEASPYWRWLRDNAEKFNYRNNVDEWWHWSPTGG